MKITESQLREIIREEISKLNRTSTRLTSLVNEGWVLSENEETVINPKTKRKIKVSSALAYPKDHPAYKAAMAGRDTTKTDSAKTDTLKTPKTLDNVYMSVRKNMNKLADSIDSSLNKMQKRYQSKDYKQVVSSAAFLAATAGAIGLGITAVVGGPQALQAVGQAVGQYSTILERALYPEAIGNAFQAINTFQATLWTGIGAGIIGGQVGVRLPAWMYRMGKQFGTQGASSAARGIANFADRKLKSRGITDSYNLIEDVKMNKDVQDKLAKQFSTIDKTKIKILEMMVQNDVLDKDGKITDYDKASDIFKQVYEDSSAK